MYKTAVLFSFLVASGCSSDDKVSDDGGVGTVGDPPVVVIVSPVDGSEIPTGLPTIIQATLDDDVTAAADLVVTIESSTSGSIDHEGSVDDDGTFTAEITLASGAQTITVSATDEDEGTGSDSIDVDVNGAPTAPAIAIDPEEPELGEGLTASVTEASIDPDGDEVTYEWAWTYQASVEDTPAAYEPDGEPTEVPEGVTERGQVWTVTATPSDSDGNVGEAGTASVVVANSPPSITDAVLAPDPAFTADDITVTASGWEDTDGDAADYRYAWTVNGEEVADAEGPVLSNGAHGKDDQVEVTVTPFDGFVYGDAIVAGPLTISNTPPSAASVSLSPVAVSTNDDITAVVEGWDDADGDEEGYLYRWFIDEVEVIGETGQVLPGTATAHFQVIVVEATPYDGEDEGEPLLSEGISIDNTPPEITGVELSPLPFTTVDRIFATATGWSDVDGDTGGNHYSWTVNGVDVGTDSPALPTILTTRGDVVQCTITPHDDTDLGAPVASEAIEVSNALPSVSSADITPNPAYTGDTLTCNWAGFEDADGDTDQSTVEWFVDGTPAGTGPDLVRGFIGGEMVSCTVTPYDGIDAGDDVISATIVIDNTGPEMTGINISPDSGIFTDTTLTCSASATDSDGDTPTITYAWTNETSGGTLGTDASVTLSPGTASPSDVITCTATATDSVGATAFESTSVTVENTNPEVTSVTVSPSSGVTSSTTLTCSATASDDDGGSPTFTYAWTNGTSGVLGTSESLELSPGIAQPMDTITCTVTATDADGGTDADGASVSVDNSSPTLESLSLGPTDASVASSLNCTPGLATDPDATTVFTYTYRWEVDAVGMTGETGSTLTAPAFERDSSVQCFATVSDGMDEGEEVGSNYLTIGNAQPVVDTITLSPEEVRTNQVISVDVEMSDADDDGTSATYEWTVNGDVLPLDEDTTSVDGAYWFDKGDVVVVNVTPIDDYGDSGDPVESDPVTILNTAPGTPTVSIVPETPDPVDDINCIIAVEATDADDDTLTYAYAWELDGVPVEGETTSFISADLTENGDIWGCTATAFDGEEDGAGGFTTAVVNDLTAPDPPLFDILPNYTNAAGQTITGICEADCIVDISCEADFGVTVESTVCDSGGSFSNAMLLPRGETTTCVATCTDMYGNESGPSVPHSVESCDPFDDYEDSTDYGDSGATAIDEWAILSDAGTEVVEIIGNVLDEDDEDWYMVNATDSVTASGTQTFDLHVDLTSGDSDYRFIVHKGSITTGAVCSSVDGYTEFNWFAEDSGDGSHGTPSDPRYCETGSTYNDCQDMSDTFYVQVYRITEPSCQEYELTITNGTP